MYDYALHDTCLDIIGQLDKIEMNSEDRRGQLLIDFNSMLGNQDPRLVPKTFPSELT